MIGSEGSNLKTGDPDPFAQLHKMSTTAGLGSGDYVAINGSAVAAILLGLASALVLFNGLYFLIIPLLGVVLGVYAFLQISRSNGTQTGREVAAIGLLLSLGFGGFSGAKVVYGSLHNRSNEQQVVSLVHKLGDRIRDKHYQDAYDLFDQGFKKRFTLTDFENHWEQMASSPVVGSVKSIDWNELLSFDIDPVSGEMVANGMMLMQAQPVQKLRISMSFRDEEGSWLIDQIPQVFPDEAPKLPQKAPPLGPIQSK